MALDEAYGIVLQPALPDVFADAAGLELKRQVDAERCLEQGE